MAKSTKIIAALGVVAGLGVAALPLASYAADPTVTDTINVTVNASCVFTAGTADDTKSITVDGNAGQVSSKRTIAASCNDEKGYKVTVHANDLAHSTNATAKFAFKGADFSASGTAAGYGISDSATLGEGNFLAQDANVLNITAAQATAETKTKDLYYQVWSGNTASGSYSGTVVYTLSVNAA